MCFLTYFLFLLLIIFSLDSNEIKLNFVITHNDDCPDTMADFSVEIQDLFRMRQNFYML